MIVYVAAPLEHIETVKYVNHKLREYGHEISYDWTKHGKLELKKLPAAAREEVDGVQRADVVVVLVLDKATRGTHVELGIALGAMNEVYLFTNLPQFLEDEACVFYFHDHVVTRWCAAGNNWREGLDEFLKVMFE